jgi:hypothetical protein
VCAKPEPGSSWSSFEEIAVSWPSRITRYLYLGDWQSASNEIVFDKLGIKHVVNCCKERNAFEDKEGFNYHNVCIVDHPSADISTYFEAVVDFIGTSSSRTRTGTRTQARRLLTRVATHTQTRPLGRSRRCWCTVTLA